MINFDTFTLQPSASTNPKKAIIGSDRCLSWQDLVHETTALRDKLRSLQVHGPVVLYGHKQADMLVAMVACMLHGVPYVPVDMLSTPRDRLLQYATRARAQLLLDIGQELDMTDTCWDQTSVKLHGNAWLDTSWSGSVAADQRVYVLFTSGSTGQPKGVQISRDAIQCFVDWMKADFPFGTDEVFLNQAPLNFDLSCYEVFASLATGGTLVLGSAELDNEGFLALARRHEVTTWVSTPSFVRRFAASRQFVQTELPSIRTFLFCGETLPVRTADRLFRNFPAAAVVNSYGPTEATVACTQINLATQKLIDRDALAVGTPMAPHTIAIRNEAGGLDFSDNTADGEIVITGANVSIGYLGLPDLNREKFFLHDGRRAFRTGDHGYKKDGVLYFIGRNSGFIKLHGYRIEPGEVAGALEQCPGVLAAAVVPIIVRAEVKRLVGFVVPDTPAPTTEAIQQDLRARIPVYMVPSECILVERLPATPNGKLDTRALLAEAGFNS